MTELWTITRVVASGRETNFGRFWVIKWSNINIFQWNLFYMISIAKLHYISKFQLNSYWNVDSMPKKPQKLGIIAIISVRDYRKATSTPSAITWVNFNFFWCGFLQLLDNQIRRLSMHGFFDFPKNVPAAGFLQFFCQNFCKKPAAGTFFEKSKNPCILKRLIWLSSSCKNPHQKN